MRERVEALIARREQMLAEVRSMLIEELKVDRELDEIDPDTPLFATGLGLDSIDLVDVVVGIEGRFGIKLEDGPRARAALRTVNSLVAYLLEARHD
jgi:acyl carrier protein